MNLQQQRSGRISRCRIETGPLYDAAVWLNRYTQYWQDQFDLLATLLDTGPAPTGEEKSSCFWSGGKMEREIKDVVGVLMG